MNTPKPLVSFWQIWNMCCGFLGLQFGFALQNANVSRMEALLAFDDALEEPEAFDAPGSLAATAVQLRESDARGLANSGRELACSGVCRGRSPVDPSTHVRIDSAAAAVTSLGLVGVCDCPGLP